MYKILTGKYNADVTPKVLRVYDSTTRGNMFKLNKDREQVRKFGFDASANQEPVFNHVQAPRPRLPNEA